MRTPSIILLSLSCLLSCGTYQGQAGEEGEPGAAGERGAMGAPGKDAVTAGSRLKPLYLIGADGSRTTFANGFYDAQRHENCAVQLMTGADVFQGPWVCAPLSMAGKLTPDTATPYVRFDVRQ